MVHLMVDCSRFSITWHHGVGMCNGEVCAKDMNENNLPRGVPVVDSGYIVIDLVKDMALVTSYENVYCDVARGRSSIWLNTEKFLPIHLYYYNILVFLLRCFSTSLMTLTNSFSNLMEHYRMFNQIGICQIYILRVMEVQVG